MLPRVLSQGLSALRRAALPTLLAVLTAALVAGPLGAPATARAAHPERLPTAERPVAGGRLDWGIKASFQTYVTGPIAGGSWSVTGGASTVGENQFRFHSATGGYDPETGALDAGYSGGVHFLGHRKDDGSHELDLVISNPSLSVSGGTGTLHADMRSKERGTGRVTEGSQVPLATVDLSGIDLRGGTQIAVTGAPTTLTERGATAFAGYYQAGDPLDPLSFTADSQDPAASGDAPEEPEEEPTESAEEDEEDPSEEATALVDAAVDWGVRRTFREYVTGPVAEGAWELTDGARDGGALFRFPLTEGALDPEAGTADAEFAGAVRFAGNDLDLTLSAVRVEVADGTGTLYADVDPGGDGEPAENQPLVTFPAEELAPEDGLVVLAEVPAALTGEGAAAFGGLYPEGAEMDPLTLALAVTEDAALPPLPDLGAEPTAPAEPAADDEPADASEATADEDDDRTPTYLAIGAGVLLALAVAFPLIRRRRATPTAGPVEPTDPVTPSVNDEETPRS